MRMVSSEPSECSTCYTFVIMGVRRRSIKTQAYVVAVNMGYGHERAASALRHFALKGEVIIANDYVGIPPKEKRMWEAGKDMYEHVSRWKRVPLVGSLAFKLMDELQEIPPFYPRRDLSRPSLQLRQTMTLIERQGMCKHLIDKLSKKPLPLICTFFTPAFAAEAHGYPGDIYLVVCDADVSRAWAPMFPKKSRIKYFAPTGRVAERLRMYGVRSENIFLTGFPISPDIVDGDEATTIREDLGRRLCSLDPQGIFAATGVSTCPAIKEKSPFSITFAIGGAGAQRELVAAALRSLSPALRRGEVVANVVAGTRREIAEYFEREFRLAGLAAARKKGNVTLLFEEKRGKYFDEFTKLMRRTDILWTKPSELSFYTGAGIPILMAPPVGSQEEFNRSWLMQIGGGTDALEPQYMDEWLFDWVKGGALARMAWNGYVSAPTHGALRIEQVLAGKLSEIKPPPLIV